MNEPPSIRNIAIDLVSARRHIDGKLFEALSADDKRDYLALLEIERAFQSIISRYYPEDQA